MSASIVPKVTVCKKYFPKNWKKDSEQGFNEWYWGKIKSYKREL